LALKLRPVSLSGVTASPATRELLARMTDPDPRKRFASYEQARSAILVTIDSLESKKTGFGALMKNLLKGKIRNR
jgi:hypothetical protein